MNFITFALKNQKLAIIIAALVGVASGGSNAAMIALVHRIIQHALYYYLWAALAFAGLVGAWFILRLVSVFMLHSIAQKRLCELRIRISRQLTHMPYRQVEQTGSSNLLASITQDLDKICIAIEQLPSLLIHSATIFGCLIYMSYLSIQVVLLNFLFISLGLVFYLYPLNLINKKLVIIRQGWDRLIFYFDSLVSGVKELLLHQQRKETFLNDCLVKSSQELRDNTIRVKLVQNLVYGWGDLLYMMGLGLILFLIKPLLGLDNGTITGYVLASLFMAPSMAAILRFGPKYNNYKVAVQKMKRMGFDLTEDIEDGDEETTVPAIVDINKENTLEFREVYYHYSNGNNSEGFRIGPINLQLKAGECCFLTGGNGSGKTTLLMLLSGLYTPDSGEIFWNGQPVPFDNLEDYRENFSAVFSDFFLFDRLFGILDSDRDKRVQNLLTQLNLDHKVSIKNGRFSTLDLSQGQRKRLALLVAYLEDRPFYLFDEWAATQDLEFKNTFYHSILPELVERGKTVVVITHDEQYFHLAPRRIKIHEGRIVEDRITG